MSKEFTFNGKSSREFNLKVKKSNHLSKPKKRIELQEIPGRTGNLVIYDGSRENLNLNIEVYLDARSSNTKTFADKLDDWLNGHEGYKPLIFDDGTELDAVFIGQIDFDNIVKNFESILLSFSAKPREVTT